MKTALILGSNSDVGKACAYRFAKERFNLLLATRTIDRFQQSLSSDLSIRFGIRVQNLNFDALNTNTHKNFYDAIETKPDVVISVFGYLGNQEKAAVDFDEANKIILTNYIANVSILGYVANQMEKNKIGAIISISSVAGERGRKSNYIYGSSKAGLTAFLSGLRSRLFASNVHVATIIPGFINTKMIEGLSTPKILTASAGQVADAVWNAWIKKKNVVYVKALWRWVMFVIRNIPEAIFKKLNI
jgi:decaprenylphospho-beta-D-erythro-pentofuranosid-2-ulose 2-reductase